MTEAAQTESPLEESHPGPTLDLDVIARRTIVVLSLYGSQGSLNFPGQRKSRFGIAFEIYLEYCHCYQIIIL